uniref:Violaxanthin/chlorophyll a binding protein n=1 Tax=Nannochloropsis sp. TaxID=52230 RepID=O50032_9STRA|nr:violaxanthin/chlorophyll a binding protein precursor [Nannochloropsis sp.]
MKTAALLTVSTLMGAQAFMAPAPKFSRTRGVARMSFENEAGVTAPLGYWDPLGLSADGDVDKFNRYRAIEIKHGRVAMLAMLHTLITGAGVTLPGLVTAGDGIPQSMPTALAPYSGAWAQGWAQVLIFCSALEVLAPQKEDKIPGDVQPDTSAFAKLDDKTEEEALKYQNTEINNGRLAMVAWTGATVGALLTNGEHPVTTLLNKLG